MNSVIQCVVLVACIAFCTSASILDCRCRKTEPAVNKTRIVKVTEYKPRPYCNKHEVIVTMKNGTQWCLNPLSPFTKILLKEKSRWQHRLTGGK
ncbi:C-X-C motif chemokine 3-like isoform X2 [Kryptolebias marmoratus]|uniref:C-X-C motif chemokine 3-like isoform X2 n=1 Tax=Kryptolebias marmoratus TaxID=37003 RepID=UPI0007F8862D|nr:C-X-C motif chemokine 3-like isoform X2 [Kryptolebias marmoratus]